MTRQQQMDELTHWGYNHGASAYIIDQIKIGNGTLDQYTFRALDLRYVAKLNAEHADYRPADMPNDQDIDTSIEFQRWTKGNHDRLYIKKATGFKNRPYQDIGYIDLKSGAIVPAHAQHESSVRTYVAKAGTTVELLLEQFGN